MSRKAATTTTATTESDKSLTQRFVDNMRKENVAMADGVCRAAREMCDFHDNNLVFFQAASLASSSTELLAEFIWDLKAVSRSLIAVHNLDGVDESASLLCRRILVVIDELRHRSTHRARVDLVDDGSDYATDDGTESMCGLGPTPRSVAPRTADADGLVHDEVEKELHWNTSGSMQEDDAVEKQPVGTEREPSSPTYDIRRNWRLASFAVTSSRFRTELRHALKQHHFDVVQGELSHEQRKRAIFPIDEQDLSLRCLMTPCLFRVVSSGAPIVPIGFLLERLDALAKGVPRSLVRKNVANGIHILPVYSGRDTHEEKLAYLRNFASGLVQIGEAWSREFVNPAAQARDARLLE